MKRSLFVPEGLYDGSLAWNAWEICGRDPSRRERYDARSQNWFTVKTVQTRSPDHTVPSGTDSRWCLSQAFHARLPSHSPYGTLYL